MIVPDKELQIEVEDDSIEISIFDAEKPRANILFAGGVGIKQSLECLIRHLKNVYSYVHRMDITNIINHLINSI